MNGLKIKASTIIKRYAKALIDSIKNQQEYQKIKRDLENFEEMIQKETNLRKGMLSMLLAKRQKRELINMVSKKMKLHKKSERFLLELSKNNRMRLLNKIIVLSQNLWYKKNNIEEITVISSIPLKKELEINLKKTLTKKMRKEIVLKKEVDDSLIAGLKLQRGCIFYDFSLKGNLKRLREYLIKEGN